MEMFYANVSLFAKLWPQIEPTSSDLSTPITTMASFTIKKPQQKKSLVLIKVLNVKPVIQPLTLEKSQSSIL
jgi:hypothetical protein